MKRLALMLVLILVLVGVSMAVHDVDTTKTLGVATRSELFRMIYDVDQAVIDSARVWYSSHASIDTLVSEDVLFDELMSRPAAALRQWETQYKEKSAPPITTTF